MGVPQKRSTIGKRFPPSPLPWQPLLALPFFPRWVSKGGRGSPCTHGSSGPGGSVPLPNYQPLEMTESHLQGVKCQKTSQRRASPLISHLWGAAPVDSLAGNKSPMGTISPLICSCRRSLRFLPHLPPFPLWAPQRAHNPHPNPSGCLQDLSLAGVSQLTTPRPAKRWGCSQSGQSPGAASPWGRCCPPRAAGPGRKLCKTSLARLGRAAGPLRSPHPCSQGAALCSRR